MSRAGAAQLRWPEDSPHELRTAKMPPVHERPGALARQIASAPATPPTSPLCGVLDLKMKMSSPASLLLVVGWYVGWGVGAEVVFLRAVGEDVLVFLFAVGEVVVVGDLVVGEGVVGEDVVGERDEDVTHA
jgi:hypothetical protein